MRERESKKKRKRKRGDVLCDGEGVDLLKERNTRELIAPRGINRDKADGLHYRTTQKTVTSTQKHIAYEERNPGNNQKKITEKNKSVLANGSSRGNGSRYSKVGLSFAATLSLVLARPCRSTFHLLLSLSLSLFSYSH